MVRNSRFNQILIIIGNIIIRIDFTKRIENGKKSNNNAIQYVLDIEQSKLQDDLDRLFFSIVSQRKKEMFKLEIKIIFARGFSLIPYQLLTELLFTFILLTD